MFADFGVIVAGLIVGSFLNVCIYRIPRRVSVIRPRSRCPNCDRLIRPWENIPVFSYLALRGRCPGCLASIGWVYPTVELLTAASLYLLYWKYGLTIAFGVNAVLFCLLIALVFIDLFMRLLPNVLTLGGAVAGLVLSPWQAAEFLGGGPVWSQLLQSALGAVFGGGILWLVAALYFRIRKIEGMGFGDVKMMVMVGAFLGWKMAWLTILLGSLAGALIGATFMWVAGKGRRYELPFGTFLGGGAMAVVLWGPDLLRWYLGLLSG